MSLLAPLLAMSLLGAQRAPVKIPPIAAVFRLRIGYSTVEEFEKLLGPGHPSVGGHPNGRRSWYDKRNKIFISLDGFDWISRGRIVDELWMESQAESPDAKVPRVSLAPKTYGFWMTSIRLGMKIEDVAAVLRKKQWRFDKGTDAIVLTQDGNLDFRGLASDVSLVVDRWFTYLDFKNGRLWQVSFSVYKRNQPLKSMEKR